MPALDFGDLGTPEGLNKLNAHLETNSYISNYSASQDDLTILAQLTSTPCSYPCVKRWAQHVLYFSEAERHAWPKGPGVSSSYKTPSCNASPAPKQADSAAPKAAAKKVDDDDDDDFDPFGEETETDKVAKEAIKEKAQQQAKPKKVVINRSTLVIDVKPTSTETDLDAVEKMVREIVIEGLEWSKASKKLPIAYGLQKLQIGATIVDDLVSSDLIIDTIETIGLSEADAKKKIGIRDGEIEEEDEDEDLGYVQSAEIVSFNKL